MLSPNEPFASNSFFRPKTISKVAIIKLRVQPLLFSLLFLFFSSLTLSFSFPFPSLLWFWSFSGLRNLPWRLFTQMTAISFGRFQENRLDVAKQFCQSFNECHFEVANGVSGRILRHNTAHLAASLPAGFLKTLSPNRPFASNSFSGQKLEL